MFLNPARKPGKGGVFNWVELKSVVKGTKLNERFRSSETVEKAEVNEKKFNFLYIDGDSCHFMDNSTFEQVEIPKSITGEQYKLLKENLEVSISFMEENPISIELPNNIECVIGQQTLQLKIKLHLHTNQLHLIVVMKLMFCLLSPEKNNN